MTALPITQPGSLMHRISEPYSARSKKPRTRWHRSPTGARCVTVGPRREQMVNLQGCCDAIVPCSLRRWLRNPPTCCLACHHERMRARAALRRKVAA